MNIYHIAKKINGRELEYYLAVGKGIFGDIYYVMDCNFEESLETILIYCIYCNGLIKFEIFSDDFCEFPEHYYEELGQLAFFDIEEILEKTQNDKPFQLFSKIQEFPNFPTRICKHFPRDLIEILEIPLRGGGDQKGQKVFN